MAGVGRKKGVRNRKTQELEAKLKKLGCDPIKGMAIIATDTRKNSDGDDVFVYSTEHRIMCLKELAAYIRPKLKSTEFTTEDDTDFNITFNEFDENGNSIDSPSQLEAPELPSTPVELLQ